MNSLGVDILIERPCGFTVAGRQFFINPPSIGVVFSLQPLIKALGVEELDDVNPIIWLVKTAEEKKRECCDIIAYATCTTREEIISGKTNEIADFLEKHLDVEGVAVSLQIVLELFGKHHKWMEEAGIADEQKRFAEILRYKGDSGSLVVGGKTIFGQLIDPAMQRYGWTYEYAVWGVSMSVVEVLLADRVNDIFISEEEKKRMPMRFFEKEQLSGDDPANIERIMKMKWG